MTGTYPQPGRLYRLPSGCHVMVEKASPDGSFQCRYVNSDGSSDGWPRVRSEVTLQPHFLVKFGRVVWR